MVMSKRKLILSNMTQFFKLSVLMICFLSFSTFFTSCDKDDDVNENTDICTFCGTTSCCDQINTENCCCSL